MKDVFKEVVGNALKNTIKNIEKMYK